MVIIKKVCAFFLISSLLFANIATGVHAYDIMDEKKYAVQQILETKKALKKVSNGEAYILGMDNMIKKLKENPENMKKSSQKVSNAIRTLENKKYYSYGEELSSSEEKILLILKYTEARIDYIEIDERQKILAAEAEEVNKILEKVENSELSDTDQEKVNTAIINIQKSLVSSAERNVTELLKDFEGMLEYKNTGNLSASLKMNIDEDKMNGELNLENYTIENSNFDSRYSGDISIKTEVTGSGEKSSMNMQGLFDMILKNGNTYMMMENFQSSIEGDEFNDIKEIFEILKEISEENKYISIEDPATAEVYEYIQSFNPEKLFSDLDKAVSQPMFTAYEKNGDKYRLLPTKYACDTFKKLLNTFDPFSPNQCSESQYNDLIKNIVNTGELTLELNRSENKLSFLAYEDQDMEELSVHIGFNSNSITAFIANLIPNQEIFPDEKIILDYEKNKKLNGYINLEDGETNILFESTLDNNNDFESIKHEGKILSSWENFVWDFNLQNRNIDGSFNISDNYENSFELKLNGSTNYSNQIDSFNSTLTLIENGEEILKGDFDYRDNQFEGNLILDSDYTESKTKISGSWNSQDSIFQELSVNSDLYIAKGTFDYKTYTYEYGELEKVFDLDYDFKSSKINGSLNIYNNSESVFGVHSEGTYSKNKLELKNKINNNFIDLYNTQTDKARDGRRLNDLKGLETALYQYYNDFGEYPTEETFNEDVGQYLSRGIPKDPSGNIEINGCKFGYIYEVGPDELGIPKGSFKISACLENEDNIEKWENLLGTDDGRIQLGGSYNGSILKDTNVIESFYINDYTTWETVEREDINVPVINFNFGYDYRDNKTDTNVYIDVIYDDEKVMEFNLENKGIIEYTEVNIEAPENTVPLEEITEKIMQKMMESYYD